MIDYDQLAQAAFDNDSRADEGITLPSIMSSLDFDYESTLRAAEQRALRMVLAERGLEWINRIKKNSYDTRYEIQELTLKERIRLHTYIIVWIDGALLAAQAIRSQDD